MTRDRVLTRETEAGSRLVLQRYARIPRKLDAAYN
jgi:hypothetical protein